MYEVIKNIPANTELIVHYLPERPEEIFFMPAVHYLRNTLYRRTMDTILEGKTFLVKCRVCVWNDENSLQKSTIIIILLSLSIKF